MRSNHLEVIQDKLLSTAVDAGGQYLLAKAPVTIDLECSI